MSTAKAPGPGVYGGFALDESVSWLLGALCGRDAARGSSVLDEDDV